MRRLGKRDGRKMLEGQVHRGRLDQACIGGLPRREICMDLGELSAGVVGGGMGCGCVNGVLRLDFSRLLGGGLAPVESSLTRTGWE
jgi:hypothetical protein